MGGEGSEEVIMGGSAAKEAKIKGDFLEHLRIDIPKLKYIKQSEAIIDGVPEEYVPEIEVPIERVPILALHCQVSEQAKVQPAEEPE